MEMINRQHFGKRGAFNCVTCGGRTRECGQENNQICAECYEIAGYENSIQDGHETPEQVMEIVNKEFLPKMQKRVGFSMEQFKDNFSIIYG